MDIAKLQGAQSFSVTKLEKAPSKEELKALENNGKVDLVIAEGDQTYLLSGEAIDINEYNTRMGEALSTYEMGPWFNPDLRPLQNMDSNDDNKLTESETRYSFGEAMSKGLDRAAQTIEGGTQVGGMYGMGYGYKLGGSTGMTVGGVTGRLFGGLAGFVSSPFTGGARAISTVGAQKDVQTWGFTRHLQDAR